MPLRYFLEISGLSGPSVFEDFQGAFEVRQFEFEATHVRTTPTGAHDDEGRSDFRALTITLPDETGLTGFLSLMATEHRGAASLIGTTPGDGGLTEVQRINLSGAVVSQVVETDNGGFIVVLNYSQIGFIDQTQRPDGSPGVPETFGFDADLDAGAPVPPDAVPGPATEEVGADKYFLLIDGVDGGSTDDAHAGWFDLTRSFALDATSMFTRFQGGSTTGRVDFDPLTVLLNDESGLTRLLSKLATGNLISGARIEGVNQDGDVVYKLDVADVRVTQVLEGQDTGYIAGLDFRRIQLVTRGQDETGALGPPQTFSYNVTTASPNIGVLPTLTPGATDGPRAATDFYLQVQNLGGPSQLEDVPGGFHIDSFQFTGAQTVSGGAAPIGVTRFSQLVVGLEDDAGLAAFLKLVSTGVHTSAVSLVGLGSDGGGGVSEAYRINLGDVVVTSVVQVGVGSVQVTLDYGKIGLIEQTQEDDGSPGIPAVFGYDIDAGHEIAPPPNAVPAATIANATASKFFMLINGVDGGSTDDQHAGWFDLPFLGFNYSVVDTAAGGMVGKVVYNPLNVRIDDNAGLTALLQKLSVGGLISGVRIEGVTNDGHAVYNLDVADVRVTDVTENIDDGFQASFDYGRIQLVTRGQRPDGSYGLDQTFSWDVPGAKPNVGTLPTIAPGNTDDPVDASTYFLEVAGLTGPSHHVHFEGAFNVQSFDFGADLVTGGGGAGSSGKAVFESLKVVLTDESGLTSFLQLVSNGLSTSAVSLIGAANQGGGALTEAYRVNLADVVVTDVEDNGGHGYVVTLRYGEIGVVVQTEKPTGQAGTPQTFGYDITDAQAGPPPPNAVPGPPSPSIGVSPDHYFLLIDGVDGGSTDARHAGWFNLQAFEFDIETMLSGGAGGGASVGKTVFAPIVVRLDNLSGLTDALDSLGLQHVIAGARLEGVGTDGRTFYKLDLAEVHVTDVAQFENGGYRASLGFDRVRLITRSQNGDGSLGPEQVFTFNAANNSPGIGTLPDISPGGAPPNHAPVAVNDGPVAVNEDATTANLTALLLGNDTDQDAGDSKSIVSVSVAGTKGHVAFDAGTQTLTYVADADSFDPLKLGQSTTDSFTYTMRDAGGLTSTATVSLTVNGVADAPTQTGGAGNDTQTGTAGDEKLDGQAGNDVLSGGEGADTLMGGLGNDSTNGGAGFDSVSASDGADTIDGGAGDDVLAGGRGADLFVFGGHFGHDVIVDFKTGEDDVRFEAAGFVSFADMISHSAQVAGNVVITNALGDTLTLNNTQIGTLQSADFLFV